LFIFFYIWQKKGKENACNIKKLPFGTVTFDEVNCKVMIGRVVQPPININYNQINGSQIEKNNALTTGSLIYENDDGNICELPFSEQSRLSGAANFTLLEGDIVQFRLSVDKRLLKQQRQPNQKRVIQLTLIKEFSLSNNAKNTGEIRERGILTRLFDANNSTSTSATKKKTTFGAIKCLEQEDIVYFSLDELIKFADLSSTVDQSDHQDNSLSNKPVPKFNIEKVDLQVGDSLEFSIIKCSKDSTYPSGLKAIRVQQLPKDTVKFEVISTETYTGFIEKEATPLNDDAPYDLTGSISFEVEGSKNKLKSIPFTVEEKGRKLYLNDKVRFQICTKYQAVNGQRQSAVNIKLIESHKEYGFVTMIKENYGFIEFMPSSNPIINKQRQSADIFFHFSSALSSINEFEIGVEVEFTINRKNRQKICADNVLRLANGTIKLNPITKQVYKGKIVQPLKSHSNNINNNSSNQDGQQTNSSSIDDAYYGKVQCLSVSGDDATTSKSDDNVDSTFHFGIFSLYDKKTCLQIGDIVSFELVSCPDGQIRAFNVQLPQSYTNNNDNRQQQSSLSTTRGMNDYKKGKIDSIKGHVS
jgi:cold shock CspA family protein